jgi:hypothetical protein
MEAEIIRTKRMLLASGPEMTPADSLALVTRAYAALIATRGEIPEAPEIPVAGPNRRAYGLLAILRAEGQMQGYGNPNCPKSILLEETTHPISSQAAKPVDFPTLQQTPLLTPLDIPQTEGAQEMAAKLADLEIRKVCASGVAEQEIHDSRAILKLGMQEEAAEEFFSTVNKSIKKASVERLRELVRASAVSVAIGDLLAIPEVYVYMIGKAIELDAW